MDDYQERNLRASRTSEEGGCWKSWGTTRISAGAIRTSLHRFGDVGRVLLVCCVSTVALVEVQLKLRISYRSYGGAILGPKKAQNVTSITYP